MRQSHIHLLGVNLEDPLCPKRLRKALESEKPEVITTQVSNQLVEYFDGDWLSDSLKRLNWYKGIKPKVKTVVEHMIREVYRSPVTTTRQYAQEKNIPIHHLGDSRDYSLIKNRLSAPQQQSIVKQINEFQTMERLLKHAENKYKTFQEWFSNPDGASQLMMYDFVSRFLPDDPQREAATAENLTKLAYQVRGKIVHVGTLEFLTDDLRGQSLYERIKHLNPTRGTVADYKNDR